MIKNNLRSRAMRDLVVNGQPALVFKLSSKSQPPPCTTENLIKPTKNWNEYLTELPTIINKTITLKFKKEYATTKPNVGGTIGLQDVDVYFFPLGAEVEKITCVYYGDGDCDEDCEDGGIYEPYYYYNNISIPIIELNKIQVELNKPLIYSKNFDNNITKRLYVLCTVEYSDEIFSFYVDLP